MNLAWMLGSAIAAVCFACAAMALEPVAALYRRIALAVGVGRRIRRRRSRSWDWGCYRAECPRSSRRPCFRRSAQNRGALLSWRRR